MQNLALKINNCSKTWNKKVVALKKLCLEIKDGEFYALLGANGAGKSTLISIVSSLARMDEGTIEIFGRDISKHRRWCKRQIGLVPQEFNFNQWEPVEEIVANTAGLFGFSLKESMERSHQVLDEVGLLTKAKEKAVALSGGMKRRLMIARAMVSEPQLLILDEPTAGVDIEIRHSIWDYLLDLNSKGKTILLTTHYFEEAEKLCRQVGFISDGEIHFQGRIDEISKGLDERIFKLVTEGTRDEINIDGGSGITIRSKNKNSLEVALSKGTSISQVCAHFEKQGINITEIKPLRSNLEEIFMQIQAIAKS